MFILPCVIADRGITTNTISCRRRRNRLILLPLDTVHSRVDNTARSSVRRAGKAVSIAIAGKITRYTSAVAAQCSCHTWHTVTRAQATYSRCAWTIQIATVQSRSIAQSLTIALIVDSACITVRAIATLAHIAIHTRVILACCRHTLIRRRAVLVHRALAHIHTKTDSTAAFVLHRACIAVVTRGVIGLKHLRWAYA